MAKRLYEERNIQDIADAIREQSSETRLEDAFADYYVYKSPNITGFDSTVGNSAYGLPETTFTIEGAVKIIVKYYLTCYDFSMVISDFWINGVNYTTEDKLVHELEITGNTVTLKYGSTTNSVVSGVYSEIRGYDADGNIIKVPTGGKVEVPNTFKVSDMGNAIRKLAVIELPEEAFKITGSTKYKFSFDSWNWFINEFGNRITTEVINDMSYFCVGSSNLTKVPFTININDCTTFAYAFQNCYKLEECPEIRGTIKWSAYADLGTMFSGCRSVRDFEDIFTPEMLEDIRTLKVTSAYSTPKFGSLFSYCYSLRKVPTWFYSLRLNEESTAYPSYSYMGYYYTFCSCLALDEIINMPVYRCAGTQTSNMFNYFVGTCYRLKNLTFETQEDGTPYEVKWKGQTIDLTVVGFAPSDSDIINYNSGITRDSEVWNDESYQARKNDPNWYGRKVEYSRYNLESAIATINSLPDTSAYLATAGGTNTIKFKKNSGLNTDGGGITADTMAEASAIAASKGWTVSIV